MTRGFDPWGSGTSSSFRWGSTTTGRSRIAARCSRSRRRRSGAAPASPPRPSRVPPADLLLMLQGRWYRFGYACVNFGSPLSLRAYNRNVASISAISPGRTVSRGGKARGVADALRRTGDSGPPRLPRLDGPPALSRRVLQRVGAESGISPGNRGTDRAGAHIYIPRADQDYASRWGANANPQETRFGDGRTVLSPFRKSFPCSCTTRTPSGTCSRKRPSAVRRIFPATDPEPMKNLLYTVYF